MKVVSSYPGNIVFPNGDAMALGDTRELTELELKNEGVKGWLVGGWLVETKPFDEKPGAKKVVK